MESPEKNNSKYFKDDETIFKSSSLKKTRSNIENLPKLPIETCNQVENCYSEDKLQNEEVLLN